MNRSARFYFANLGADIARCVVAAQADNAERYAQSLARARQTLALLRTAGRPEAYEEGLLSLRALELAREDGRLDSFQSMVSAMVAPMVRLGL
jgi:hypothetical protein